MFFDEELVEVGRKSNPKNNLSMNNALSVMKEMCQARIRNAKPEDKGYYTKNTANNFKLALKTLYKEGYPFFNPEKHNID